MPKFLRRADDAARDHIATHDAAENVNQYSAHVFVREQNLEGCFDARLRCAAADIQKIRGFAARGVLMMSIVAIAKPAPFDHARDVAIELDVVQIKTWDASISKGSSSLRSRKSAKSG